MTLENFKLDEYFKQFPLPDNLNETDIELMKNWINGQPHLPKISNRQISIFLHCCYAALEMTKNTIDSYYTIRTLTPEMFSNRTVKTFMETLKVVYVFELPALSCDKYRIFYGGLKDLDPEKLVVPEVLSLFFCLVDMKSNLIPYADGWRIVIDAKGFTFGHFIKLTSNMSVIRKAICYVQDGLPIRLKGIHVFNAIPLISQFVLLIKPFMKKELYDLINIHSTADMESLYKFVAQEKLPSDAGGKSGTVNDFEKLTADIFEKYSDWLADDENLARTDESRRTGKLKNQNEIFGIEGSFKKLNVD